MRNASARRRLRNAVVALGALVAIGGTGAAAHASVPDTPEGVSAVAVATQQRKPVKVERLADGSVAKIYKVGDRYEASIFFRGKKIATLSSTTTVFRHHGVNYSFHPYKGSVWAEKGKSVKPRPGGPVNPIPNPNPDPDDDTAPPVPAPNPNPDDDTAPPVPAPNPNPDDDPAQPVPAPGPAADDSTTPQSSDA
ncbi:hypothetical protein [Streptomyces sp. NPDC031705]|uniref:hypothetical protein n=1 Tax=Streptomyces sp. NPDC031705 TaxID=3155729 RepID=UPI0033F833D8